MYRMQLALALAATAGLGGWWLPGRAALDQLPAAAQTAAAPVDAPAAPWLQGDPADSLYRAAREALNRRDYRRAAELFAALPGRYPASGYAPDAYYWQAFALYRL
ncbi:MAG TPA: outer membrane protein assembly factor BamD, partial [Gemmatimonadales bacterium]